MEFLPRIADLVLNTPLALEPRKAAVIGAVLGNRIGIDGDVTSFARSIDRPVHARRSSAASSPRGYAKGNGFAVVTIAGSLVPRAGYLDAESGLLSYDRIKAQMMAADRDKDVTSIVLDIHSPGGTVQGAFETSDLIHEIARRRPVIAVANSMACSAAYAIAAAANRIVVSPTGIVGSIGVVCLHLDRSRQMDARGIVPTFIFAGARKAAGNALQPLTEDDRSEIQGEIDTCMDLFVAAVARYRPKLSEQSIRDTEARTFMGADAISVGLADELGTIESVIAQLAALHPVADEAFARTERLYGTAQAMHEKLKAEHARGVRAGMAAALAGRKDFT